MNSLVKYLINYIFCRLVVFDDLYILLKCNLFKMKRGEIGSFKSNWNNWFKLIKGTLRK